MNKKNILFTFCLAACLVLPSCSENQSSDNNVTTSSKAFAGQELTIYNCEDYISSGEDDSVDLIAKFEEETGAKVNYYTYDTNETMYNQFTLQNEGTYDLICTSEYMIQKMVKNGLVQPLDDKETYIPNYAKYCSSTMREKLASMKVANDMTLDDYAVGYMWGTLGIVYNPETVDEEDVTSWDIFWNEDYKDQISIKNSMRDTFVVGLMHRYSKDENFKQIMDAYLEDPSDENCQAYNDLIQDIFDFDLSDNEDAEAKNLEKIEAVKEELIEVKKNIFGLEVDSGKSDIITGKIQMNLAWSGDAVYSIQTAAEAENPKELKYSVPLDGANVWYDAWSMPKGANKELAYKFLDFMSDPSNAKENESYIGYTSCIAGDEVFSLVSGWYGASEYSPSVAYSYYDEDEYGDAVIYEGELYECVKNTYDENDELISEATIDNENYFTSCEYTEDETYAYDDMVSLDGNFYNCITDEEGTTNSLDNKVIKKLEDGEEDDNWEKVEPYDISYFFGELESERKPVIYAYASSQNQLETQYPTKETIARCGVMNDFDKYNEKVIIMWGQVKAYTDMTPFYIFLGVVAGLVVALVTYLIVSKKISARSKRLLAKCE